MSEQKYMRIYRLLAYCLMLVTNEFRIWSEHHLSTIEVNASSGVAGLAGQIADQPRCLRRLQDAADGYGLGVPCVELSAGEACRLRVDVLLWRVGVPWRDGIDPHLGRQFSCQRLGQADYPALAGAVGAKSRFSGDRPRGG